MIYPTSNNIINTALRTFARPAVETVSRFLIYASRLIGQPLSTFVTNPEHNAMRQQRQKCMWLKWLHVRDTPECVGILGNACGISVVESGILCLFELE